MSVVLIGEKSSPTGTPYYMRKIRCPGHYLIPPNVDIYKREPVNLLKNITPWVAEKYKLTKFRRAKDKWGRPIIDWRKLQELRRQGIVKQPMISAAFAIEHVWDPKSALCMNCQKWCKEGQGRINEYSIKRLHG
jgi:hypothetical protein